MTLRSKLIQSSSKSFRTRAVEIQAGDEVLTVEVRSPTVGQASDFAAAAQGGKAADLMADMVIGCSYDPTTGERIFGPADKGVILESPMQGGFVGPIRDAVMELIDEAKDSAKN